MVKITMMNATASGETGVSCNKSTAEAIIVPSIRPNNGKERIAQRKCPADIGISFLIGIVVKNCKLISSPFQKPFTIHTTAPSSVLFVRHPYVWKFDKPNHHTYPALRNLTDTPYRQINYPPEVLYG